MKKILSLVVALAMILSMVPSVFAVEDQLPPDVEVQGTVDNPIFPEFVWNDEWTEATVTVTAPVGTTYYAVYGGAGMLLNINGEEYGILTANGMGRVPAVFTITNDGEAAAEYTLKLSHPVGSQMNPAEVSMGYMEVSLEANDYDGYYYTYTAEGDGTVTVYFTELPEGVNADIVIYNHNTYEQKSLLTDGVDNYGMELTVEVSAGDELSLQVVVQPDKEFNYPAADLGWVASFAAVEGTEQNPIFPEFVWNDEWTEATVTVTAPVGTTYYGVYGGAGMLLNINGEDKGAMEAMPRMPAVFSITNEGDAPAEYVLKISYPVGTRMNPEVTELGGEVSLEANNFEGYYYSYTAEADGTVTVFIDGITEGVEADIAIYNNNTYEQKSLVADGVDNYGLELTVEVSAGDVLTLQVVVMPDKEFNYPAADVSWTGYFTAAPGSQQNPIIPEWELNEKNGEATATVTAPVGTTYYGIYGGQGMILYINGEEYGVLTADGMGFVPAAFPIVNEGDAPAEYELKAVWPAGTSSNPAELEMGTHNIELAAGSEGYFYTWTAEKDGTLHFEISGDTEWFYVIGNETTGAYTDWNYSSDGASAVAEMEVAAGDIIKIQVNTHDPEVFWTSPAGKLTIKVSFTAKEVEGDVTVGDATDDGSVDQSDVTLLFAYIMGQAEGVELPAAADVTGDGAIDQSDVTKLFAYIMGQIDSL